jgi:phosphopantothenate---cysteine ligase (ATP)
VEKDEPLDPKSLPEGEPEIEIEGLIIPAVKELHAKYIEAYKKREAAKGEK